MEERLYQEFYAVERTHWWSVGMRGIFHMLLGAAIRDLRDPRILDLGCGTGITMEEFRRHGRILGVDLAWEALLHVRKRDPAFALVQADLAGLPIAAGSVEVVLAFDVLEHLADDAGAVREIHRVLRPGGVALLNVPAFPSLWSGKDDANHHRRRYTTASLRRLLEREGFVAERLTYTNATLFLPIWCARQIQRRTRRPWDSEAEYHPRPFVNRTLIRLLGAERALLRRFDLPFGTSVTCLARRKP